MTISIFHDQQQFKTHKLSKEWSLWYDDGNQIKQNPKLTWKENLKLIHTFSTIEEFLSLVSYIKPPSEIPASANYHLFIKGIEPMWEHVENAKGGKWTFNHPKGKRGPELDKIWLSIMINVMSDKISQINGCVISIRKTQDRISVWTQKSDESVLKIGLI